MNKSDLVQRLNDRNSLLSPGDIELTINNIINLISESLSQGERIEIRGFGSFSVRKRDKRIGRNPKTGKHISVEKKYHPYFRASKDVKETLKNSI